ncbi:MAG: hypothetical protein CME41_18585 [Haliea sp.]|nr:hypothetical protein [Haliea sp.]
MKPIQRRKLTPRERWGYTILILFLVGLRFIPYIIDLIWYPNPWNAFLLTAVIIFLVVSTILLLKHAKV